MGVLTLREASGRTLSGILLAYASPTKSSTMLRPTIIFNLLCMLLCYTHPRDSEEVRVHRALMATSLVLWAQGTPSFMLGQNLRTKRLIENTYNATG